MLFIIYLLVVVLILRRLGYFRLDNFRGYGLYFILVTKLIIAIVLHHYPYETMKDSQVYLNDSRLLSSIFWQSPKDFFSVFLHLSDALELDLKHMLESKYWSHEKTGFLSEKRNVIRVNALFQLLGFHNPYIVFLWNSILSISGLKLLYLGLRKRCKDPKNLLFFLIFLLPSTLIWTTNIMKENFLVLGLGIFIYGLLGTTQLNKRVFYMGLGWLITLMFKQYVAFGLLIGVMFYFVASLKTARHRVVGLAVLGVLFASGFYFMGSKFTAHISKKQFDFIQLASGGMVLYDSGKTIRIEPKQEEHVFLFEGSDKNVYAKIIHKVKAHVQNPGEKAYTVVLEPSDKNWYVLIDGKESGSRINLTAINNSTSQLIRNVPEALTNVFLRPWPNDPPRSILKWYFVIETWMLWAMIIFGLTRIKHVTDKKVLIFFLFFSIAVGLFIGWTTPVLGALVRYKLPIVLSIISASWLLLRPIKKVEHKEQIS